MSTSRIHIVACLWVLAASVSLAAPSQSLAQKGRPAQKRSPTPTPAEQADSSEFNRLSRQADEARAGGRLDEAIVLYNRALKLKPRWPEGWWYLGSIFYDRDRYFEAREALRNFLSLAPRSGSGWALVGLCEFQAREYEHALADIRRAWTLGVGDKKEFLSVLRYHTGILLTRFEEFEPAFDYLRTFVRDGNESPRIVEALGLNLLRMPYLPTEFPPDKRELVLLAGRAAYFAGGLHAAEAKTAFEELRRRYPEEPNVHYACGSFLLSSNPDAALDEFRQELKMTPTHLPSLLQIAFEYIKRNDYEAARPFAEKSVQLAPGIVGTHHALGNVLLEMGDIPGAIKELEKGAEMAPDSPEMHFVLAKAYSRAGRKEDAARERNTFLRLDKERRTQREGAQSVGGLEAKPGDRNPPQK